MGIQGLGGLGGLISGLDTKTLIQQLMKIESQPLYDMQIQQKKLDLKKGLYGEINSALLALQQKIKALTDPAVVLKQKVTSSDTSVATVSIADQTKVAAGTYNLSITQLATRRYGISADQTANMNPTTGALGYSGTFNIVYSKTVNGTTTTVTSQTITISATDTLATIANRINSALDNTATPSAMPVQATVVGNRLVLSTKDTGSGQNIQIINDTNGIFGAGKLGLVDASGNLITNASDPTAVGQDAVFTVNGISFTRRSNTNLTDVISGVSLNLLKGTSASPGTATLTVEADLDAAVQAVKDFIAQYNSVMDLLNTRLNEKPVKDAQTDVGMSKGLLNSDPTLYRIQNSLRSPVSQAYTSSAIYKTLSSIGITTDSTNFGKSGHLVLDETKLRNALSSNPTEVMKVFFKDTNGNGALDKADTGAAAGFAATLYNKISFITDSTSVSYGTKSAPNGLLPAVMDALNNQIKDYDERMDAFKRILALRQQSLERQFTMLESILSQNNAQKSFLAARLGVGIQG